MPFSGKPTKDWPVTSKMRWCTMTDPSHCWISVSSYKPLITATGSGRQRSSMRLTRRVRLTLRVTRKLLETLRPHPGVRPWRIQSPVCLTGKLGKDGKLTPQEHQHHMDNSLCLCCGKTRHIAKECLKSMAIAAWAHAAVAELQESFVKEAKKD